MARGPSPRDDAARRRSDRDGRAPSQQWRDDDNAPWLDEAEEDDGPVHTLIGRRTLFALLFLAGVLTVGIVVGIMLVSRREATPIDVPAVGEPVPVLASPGPWKVRPTGPGTDGVPVEGQGQVLFGTGDGRETDAQISLDAMPEAPLPRPGQQIVDEGAPVITQVPANAPPALPPAATAAPAPVPVARAPLPRSTDTLVPREANAKPAAPKVAPAPPPAPRATAGSGQVLQLGAFSSESKARAVFKDLSARYGYLQGLEPMIVPVLSDGRTLYRLRSTAASAPAARDICARLRVAGEACSVVD